MQTSKGKIVAQVHYASRLPRVRGRQDHLRRILPPILNIDKQNCDPDHSIYIQTNLNGMKKSGSCGRESWGNSRVRGDNSAHSPPIAPRWRPNILVRLPATVLPRNVL